MNIARIIIYISFCIFSYAPSKAQNHIKQDSIKQNINADSLISKATALFRSNNLDSAVVLYTAASQKYVEVQNWKKYIETLNTLAAVQYNRDDFGQFKSITNKTLSEAARLLGTSHTEYSIALNNSASIYRITGDYKKCIDQLNKSLESLKDTPGFELELAAVLQNLAVNYRLLNDLQKTLNYRKKALELYTSKLSTSDLRIGKTYKDIGMTFMELNKLDSAIFYLNKAYSITKKQKAPHSIPTIRNLIMTYHGQANVSLLRSNPQKAISFVKKAIELQEGNKAFRKAFSFELLAKIHIASKNYNLAQKAINKANYLANLNYKNNAYPKIARKLLLTAEIFQHQNQLDSALIYAQKGLQVLAPDYQFNNSMENPPVDQLLDKSNAMDLLISKALLLNKLYQTKRDTSFLSQAFKTYSSCVDLIRYRRQGILSNSAKTDLAEKSISVYEGAIRTALQLNQITKDTKFKEEAFRLAENNKALLLLESINEQFAQGFANIPDSLLAKEKELRIDKAYFQKKILEEKQNKDKADVTKLNIWKNDIFDLQQEHDLLISHLEENYPTYQSLKYNNKPAEIKNIRSTLLNAKNALIEYFVGNENTYIFCLTKKDIQIKKIKVEEINIEEIQKLRSFISSPPNEGISAIQLEEFKKLANKFYEILLKPIIDELDKEVDELFIVPDGQLAYIPFDVLLTNPAQTNPPQMPDAADYLLHRYSISYDYSATLLVNNTTREITSHRSNFMGFAPSFQGKSSMLRNCDGSELSQLKCNQEEIEKISAILEGNANIGHHASTSNFKNLKENFNIIHLATHACADIENPSLNKVYFSDDHLSVSDFNNTRLKTQLVVLSACNTGYGHLAKGEGVMSIARGLMVAGSPSNMISLWSVDDCSTSDLMVHYYQNLKEGKKKNKALQMAKLAFLNDAQNSLKHPFYWGPFVQFGNSQPIEFGSTFNWFYCLGGIVVGFLIIGLILLLKKSK